MNDTKNSAGCLFRGLVIFPVHDPRLLESVYARAPLTTQQLLILISYIQATYILPRSTNSLKNTHEQMRIDSYPICGPLYTYNKITRIRII
ncbi:hypothetical protein I7I50_07198 [Histoplasma capsulatum G186AR]|uniref:Uncharacterized protein n=1 Tax=Ajellomyces capsulatus TaxID=5037 RepID=A0A8H7YZV7_AJECA|nr:hypothetical protein I7I52_09730 [Histoplasma capsulatum]QSS67956.1 hypothetical protein I7I50_07198 [Histoplasma capsulatum G186AR]